MLILVAVSIDLIIDGRLFNSAAKAVNKNNKKVEQYQSRLDELMGELDEVNEREKNAIIAKNSSIITDIQDGLALISVADLMEPTRMVQRLMEDAVNLSNETSFTDETARAEIIAEMEGLLDELDWVSGYTKFNDELLWDGTIARDIAVSGMFLQIDDMSSKGLGLYSSNLDTEFDTTESVEAYIEKIDQALSKVAENNGRIGAISTGLGYLKDYYTEENNILNSNDSDMDKKIAKNGLTEIKTILNDDIKLFDYIIDGTYYEDEWGSCEKQIEASIIAIDHICQNCEYSDEKLLDGTYSNISKINSTTLGGGTKLGADGATVTKAETLKTQYQNAISMIETEIAKLDV